MTRMHILAAICVGLALAVYLDGPSTGAAGLLVLGLLLEGAGWIAWTHAQRTSSADRRESSR